MANLKEVRNRIASVNSTQQITKAMKMVSAAKLKRATDAIVQMRPFANKLNEVLRNVSAGLDTSENAFSQVREVNKVLIIAITSDKGLCGGFNTNITKQVTHLLNDTYAGKDVTILTVGKKAKDFCRRGALKCNDDYSELFFNLSFENASNAAQYVMDSFLDGTYDQVILSYNEFKNVATQIVHADQFLPIEAKENANEGDSNVDYFYEPSKANILEDLIPKSLKTQFYAALLDSNASEHGARMSAMDKATDNAGDLLKELKLVYNRTRQAAITTEILEIVGGAEALAASK
jgi:F-type H+-transporting ATPase subunit gamma